MKGRHQIAVVILFLGIVGASWGGLSASAAPSVDPPPSPSATGSSQVGFTVGDTPSPTPSPSTGGGSTGGGSTGGGSHGGSGGSGSGDSTGGGTTTPVCVPSTTTPRLPGAPSSHPGVLKLSTHEAAQGSDLTVTGEGFQVGEKVELALYSSVTKLGVVTVRTNGQLSAQIEIPEKTQLGTHTIEAIGFEDCKVSAGTLEIVSPSGSGSSLFPWIVWVVAGGGVGLACLGLILALIFGWLPKLFAVGIAARSVS